MKISTILLSGFVVCSTVLVPVQANVSRILARAKFVRNIVEKLIGKGQQRPAPQGVLSKERQEQLISQIRRGVREYLKESGASK